MAMFVAVSILSPVNIHTRMPALRSISNVGFTFSYSHTHTCQNDSIWDEMNDNGMRISVRDRIRVRVRVRAGVQIGLQASG